MRESDEFRKQYCLFWKSLFLLDQKSIQEICHRWGINDPQMFGMCSVFYFSPHLLNESKFLILITDITFSIANATLLKPYNMNRSPSITPTTNTSVLDAYEIQMKLKTSLKEFLINSELLPKELIFIGRNMTIVRANNKTLGSPVNRINRMARWAVVGLGHDMNLWTSRSTGDMLSGNSSAISRNTRLGFWKALSSSLQASFNYWMFEVALALMSVAYHFAQFKSYLERTVLGKQSAGFEAVLDDALKQKLEQEYGIKIEGDLFDA